MSLCSLGCCETSADWANLVLKEISLPLPCLFWDLKAFAATAQPLLKFSIVDVFVMFSDTSASFEMISFSILI